MDVLRAQWWGDGLLSAAAEGDVDEMRRVMDQQTDPALLLDAPPGESGLAGFSGTPEDLERVLRRRRRVAVNFKNEDGMSATHMAVQGGHRAALRWLVAQGADIDAQTAYGRAPLHLAVAGGELAIVDEVLALGANPAARNANGFTPSSAALGEARGNESIIADTRRGVADAARLHAGGVRKMEKLLRQARREVAAHEQERDDERAKIDRWRRRAREIEDIERLEGRLLKGLREERFDVDANVKVSLALLDGMDADVEEAQRGVRSVEVDIEDLEQEHEEHLRPMQERIETLRSRNDFLAEAARRAAPDKGAAAAAAERAAAEAAAAAAAAAEAARAAEQECFAGEAAERRKLCDELRTAFDEADVGGKGWLTAEELTAACLRVGECDAELGVVSAAADPDPGKEALRYLERMGALRDGQVHFDEFCLATLRLSQR